MASQREEKKMENKAKESVEREEEREGGIENNYADDIELD